MRKVYTRYVIALMLLVSAIVVAGTIERGIPFFKNYSADDYNANTQNFDVLCDDYGTTFFANFEGLLYYDGATWRTVHTPGISRVTRLCKGPDGRIWIGGNNVFGYLTADDHGSLKIKTLLSDADSKGNDEFDDIKIAGNIIYAHTTMGKVYRVDKGEKLKAVSGYSNLFETKAGETPEITLPDGVKVEYMNTEGIDFRLPDHSTMGISESNGLISNSITAVAYNGVNLLWGAASTGIFSMQVNTPYSRLTEKEGLKGEVYGIGEVGGTVYIGTQNGLYTLRNGVVTSVKGIDLACWDIVPDKYGRLILPTSGGLYAVSTTGIKKISGNNTYSAGIDPKTGDIIAGEDAGIFRITEKGHREKISSLEKAMYLTFDNGCLNARTIFGSQWQISKSADGKIHEKCLSKEADTSVSEVDYTDRYGRQWVTDFEGYNLQIKGNNAKYLAPWIYPFTTLCVEAVYVCQDGNVIVGGDFGIIILDSHVAAGIKTHEPEKPYIRSVTIMGDSILWGGYSQKDLSPVTSIGDLDLPVGCSNLTVTFSTKTISIIGPMQYRYRLNGGTWSSWSAEGSVTFKTPQPGDINLEIQARDGFGRVSEVSTVNGYIHYPYHERWYAFIFYIFVTGGIVYLFFRWRTKRLEKEKMKLEGIVDERTSELRDTLDDLKRTQDDLVRMERTATAGKLTQGLIDRILNPINYINNFSKLTSNLAHDLHEDIEDEKEHMSEDNYDDCEDILGMMDQNLQKIEEHGVNTTRTLRAMEAILNTHIGTLTQQDIGALCRQAMQVTEEHYKEAIQQSAIKMTLDIPQEPVMVSVDADAFNHVVLSLLNNSIYAVRKKYSQAPYNAEISLRLNVDADADANVDGNVNLSIRDNGIGIEDTIKEKVYDPFFTTKPTGEAAGVGLYLVRELVHDHNATITLDSQQGEYCEFKIVFNHD